MGLVREPGPITDSTVPAAKSKNPHRQHELERPRLGGSEWTNQSSATRRFNRRPIIRQRAARRSSDRIATARTAAGRDACANHPACYCAAPALSFMGLKKLLLNLPGILAILLMSVFAQEPWATNGTADQVPLLAQNSASTSAEARSSPQAVLSNSPAAKQATLGTVSAVPRATPSQNVTINLIHRLVERGVLTQADADELIKQAEQDAATARELAAKQNQRQAPPATDVAPGFFAEPTPIAQSATKSSGVPSTSSSEPKPPAE